jgi:hypothetical protein
MEEERGVNAPVMRLVERRREAGPVDGKVRRRCWAGGGRGLNGVVDRWARVTELAV